jgi:CRP-like cAMP-binding protein
LLVIDRRNFIQFVQHQPEAAAKLLEVLCGRLRHTNEQVEGMMFTSRMVRLAKLLLKFSPTGEVYSRVPGVHTVGLAVAALGARVGPKLHLTVVWVGRYQLDNHRA